LGPGAWEVLRDFVDRGTGADRGVKGGLVFGWRVRLGGLVVWWVGLVCGVVFLFLCFVLLFRLARRTSATVSLSVKFILAHRNGF